MADSRPQTLSGGQQQRVALARALACQPRVLLLDEPFAALNSLLRRSLRQELATVCRRWDVPTVMITHDIEDVLALAEVACVYEDGRVVRQVPVRELPPGQALLRLGADVEAPLDPEREALLRRLEGRPVLSAMPLPR
jgi:molybdate transport system ATP-binding protein